MAAEAAPAGDPLPGMPTWARCLEKAFRAITALMVFSGLLQLQETMKSLGFAAEDELSAEWQAREASLLQWGMAHLRNCTAAPSVPRAEESEPECHVVYSADAKMFAGLLTSMLSMARHLKQPRQCSVHLIVSDADYDQAVEVVECFKRELEALPSLPAVLLHRMLPLPVDVSAYDRAAAWRLYDRNLPQMYVRWYLHEYLPQASRALWLDADTLVRADVAQLLRAAAPARGALAAVPEGRQIFWRRRVLDLPTTPRSGALYEALDGDKWFNPGVLVINLDKWRGRKFTRSLESWLNQTQGYMGIQMVLNLEFQDGVDSLDWQWNLHSLGRMRYPEPCLDGAHILHAGAANYDLFEPWECHSLVYTLAQPYEAARLRCSALQRPERAAPAEGPAAAE